MSEPTQSGSSGGCLRRLLSFFIMLMVCGLGAAMFYVAQPQDISDAGGLAQAPNGETSRDLKAVLRASLDRGHKVTISESEINSWLARTLTAKQGGPLAEWISMGRVCVRLEEDVAEIIMERRAFGRPFTVSMFVKIEQTEENGRVRTVIERHGGPYSPDLPKPMRGGRFGQLVVPQGFLMLVVPAYEQLAGIYQEEIHLAFEEMSRIRIEPNRLVLDPRPDGNSTESF